MVPQWLHILSIASLLLGFACAVLIAVDVRRHPQQMGIMNIVWPVTALFGQPARGVGLFRLRPIGDQSEIAGRHEA